MQLTLVLFCGSFFSYKDKILLDLFESVIMVLKKNQRFEKIAAQAFEADDFLKIF